MKNITVKTLCLLLVALLATSSLALFKLVKAGGVAYGTMYLRPSVNDFYYIAPDEVRDPKQVLPTERAQVNDWFLVEVRIKDYSTYAWQFKLKFNATQISCTGGYYALDHIFGTTHTTTPLVVDPSGYALQTASTNPWRNVTGTDGGLYVLNFTILIVPPVGQTYLCSLDIDVTTGDSWVADNTPDYNDVTDEDGSYSIEGRAPPPPYLEISPTVVKKPTIAGDRIVGTPAALFSVDINIKGVDSSDELFLVQLTLSFNATLLKGIWIDEGTFMNDAAWAPHGTIDNATEIDPGKMVYYVMIAPNASGYWDNTAWPSGNGLLATARFEVILQGPDSDGMAPEELFGSSALTLSGVFAEFFLGHPNKEPEPDYLPYSAPVNGSVNIYRYYWQLPVAAFTWTPLNPLPATIANFDASASFGYKNVGGVLIADPTVLVEYKWNWGDGKPDNVSASPLMTHIFDAMGLYTVTLTVKDYNDMTDPESKVINVVFGRLIDVFTQYGPPFGGQGQNLPSDMFWPQKPVILTAILTYNGDPVQHKPVAFQVISPTGYWNFTRVVFSDSDGVAIMTFGLPWPCDYAEDLVFGVWTVVVKADIQCQPVEDLLWFKCYWYTHDMTVTPKETEYHKTETAEFDIDFYSCSSQVRPVLVTLVVFDDLDVPVGQASVWLDVGNSSLVWCTFDHYHTVLSVYLPKYAYVGTGKVYVNTFFLWPIDCGYALSPEASAEFFLLKPP